MLAAQCQYRILDRLRSRVRTAVKALKQTFLPFGSSTEIADVDPRYDSLSRAYRIIVRKTKAEEPSGFHFAVTHVSGLLCNASAKYAQELNHFHSRGRPPAHPRGSWVTM
jgi:hypothetical protein